jgi:hypothetical protein
MEEHRAASAAHVNALFEGTRMAALVAARDDHSRPQPAPHGRKTIPIAAHELA